MAVLVVEQVVDLMIVMGIGLNRSGGCVDDGDSGGSSDDLHHDNNYMIRSIMIT